MGVEFSIEDIELMAGEQRQFLVGKAGVRPL
jgi:hypothetical protein